MPKIILRAQDLRVETGYGDIPIFVDMNMSEENFQQFLLSLYTKDPVSFERIVADAHPPTPAANVPFFDAFLAAVVKRLQFAHDNPNEYPAIKNHFEGYWRLETIIDLYLRTANDLDQIKRHPQLTLDIFHTLVRLAALTWKIARDLSLLPEDSTHA